MRNPREWRRWAAILLAGLFGAAAQASTPWPEEDFNPVPMPGDVILPAPCGGSIAFRQVTTGTLSSSDSPAFSDTPLWLGWGGARDTAFQEAEWRAHVAGGLTDDRRRYYLIAKYEITADQYTAVMERPCESGSPDALPSFDAGLPAERLSWFDAIEFGRRYTQWLHENHAEQMPPTFGGTAFVRLPSEAEWEFAARGGLAVTDTVRRDGRFPMPKGLEAYGWHAGTASARGEIQFIGLLDPNPLGLFDIYGNIAELVQEGFRTNKAGRLHGLMGASILKGGSYLNPAEALRSGSRVELALYGEGGRIIQRRGVGFRPVISGLATGDLSHAQALAEQWASLGDIRTDDGSVVDRLREIADDTADRTLRAALNEAATAIGAEIREREEQEREALQNLVTSAGIMAYRLQNLHLNINGMRALRVHERGIADDATEREKRNYAQYTLTMQEFGQFAEVYADTVLRVLDRYDRDAVVEMARRVGAAHAEKDRARLRAATLAFGIRIRDHDQIGGWDRRAVVLHVFQTLQVFEEPPEWFDEALGT